MSTILFDWDPVVGDMCTVERPYFFSADLKGSVAVIAAVCRDQTTGVPNGYVNIIVPGTGQQLDSWLTGRLKPLPKET